MTGEVPDVVIVLALMMGALNVGFMLGRVFERWDPERGRSKRARSGAIHSDFRPRPDPLGAALRKILQDAESLDE